MRRGRSLVKRIDAHGAKHAEFNRKLLLKCRVAFRLRHVMRERRPRQSDAGAFGLGRRALRLGAADCGDTTFAARNALGCFMQVADRALSADRSIVSVPRLDAETG